MSAEVAMLTVMAVEFPAVTVPLVGVAASQGPPLAVAAERAKESGQDPVAAVSVMLKVSAEGFVPCTTDLETVPGMPLISAGVVGLAWSWCPQAQRMQQRMAIRMPMASSHRQDGPSA